MTCPFSLIPIQKEVAYQMVSQYHYSGRKPNIVYTWGLSEEGKGIVGCVTYSNPASWTLLVGVCGEEYKKHVIELSRLVIRTDTRNAASFLVGQSLQQLGKEKEKQGKEGAIVVAYADCNTHVGHVGFVYQATNWLYTGQGNAEPLWLHPVTKEVVSYTRRWIQKKAYQLGLVNDKFMEDYEEGIVGDADLPFIKKKQEGKYRYVTFVGNKWFRKKARAALRYPVLSYPKGWGGEKRIASKRHSGPIMQTCYEKGKEEKKGGNEKGQKDLFNLFGL